MLVYNRQTDRQNINGWIDRQTGRWMDGRTGRQTRTGWTHGPTDKRMDS
jgi:hypothetical protein